MFNKFDRVKFKKGKKTETGIIIKIDNNGENVKYGIMVGDDICEIETVEEKDIIGSANS